MLHLLQSIIELVIVSLLFIVLTISYCLKLVIEAVIVKFKKVKNAYKVRKKEKTQEKGLSLI